MNSKQPSLNKVLIISQKFPPYNGVGGIRASKFAKYLMEFNWQPVILTTQRESTTQDAIDAEQLSDFFGKVPIYDTWYPNLFDIYRIFRGKIKQGSLAITDKHTYSWIRNLLIPDIHVGWTLTGAQCGQSIYQSHEFQLIWSTSPCQTAHLVAKKLKHKLGCPWIADFRDPWMEKFQRPSRPKFLDRIEYRMQKSVLKEADQVTVAWPGILKGFKQAYPGIESKTHLILNGFDEEDFRNITAESFSKFSLIFVGSVYKALIPEPLFEALHFLFESHPILRSQVQFLMVGRQDPFVHNLISKYQLSNEVKCIDQVSLKQSLQFVLGAHILCLFLPNDDVIPSKVYEYLRAERPILVVGNSNSDAARYIENLCAKVSFASRKSKPLADFIQQQALSHTDRKVSQVDAIKYQSLTRHHLTSQLADLFDQTLRV